MKKCMINNLKFWKPVALTLLLGMQVHTAQAETGTVNEAQSAMQWSGAAGALLSFTWPAGTNKLFLLCLEPDGQGGFWVGEDGNGLWHFDPAGAVESRWRNFTTRDGLAEDNVLALRLDRAGRLWAGHSSRGVSVFSGGKWKAYSSVTGPLSGRVSDIRVAPDGNVWLATDTGLAIYESGSDCWRYLTTRNGLPDNQVQTVAFDGSGHVIIGMQTAGVLVGMWTPAKGFVRLQHAKGPDQLEPAVRGKGLPSGLINCMLVAHDGVVYVGTPDGLAVSRDAGVTWGSWHGPDFIDKVKGLYRRSQKDGAPLTSAEPAVVALESQLPLSEDWVTCLAEDEAGHVWVGFRQSGYQVFDPAAMKSLHTVTDVLSGNVKKRGKEKPYVRAIMLGKGIGPLLALRNFGLAQSDFPANARPVPAVTSGVHAVNAMPSQAASPTREELLAYSREIAGDQEQLEPGDAVCLGTDWQTRGDWVGKWGQHYADIYSHNMFSHSVSLGGQREPEYKISYACGPMAEDRVCNYLPNYSETIAGALYNPYIGCRALAEVNDATFSGWPHQHEGPDVWVTVNLEHKGLHRVSLYFCNSDADTGLNSLRDFVAVVHKTGTRLEPLDLRTPVQAVSRIRDFKGGVYVQFLVCGPHTYRLRVARNYSFVGKLQGVFIDKLSGSTVVNEFSSRSPGLADIYYGPLDTDLLPQTAGGDKPLLQAARELWNTLRNHVGYRKAAALDNEARLMAYRAALAAGAHPEHLRAWRWQMNLWEPADQSAFIEAMRLGWDSYEFEKKNNPDRPVYRIWESSKAGGVAQ